MESFTITKRIAKNGKQNVLVKTAVQEESEQSLDIGSSKLIYQFEEGGKEMADLLGSKGAHLAEMTKLGLPVPPGFTIATTAARHTAKDKLSRNLEKQLKEAIHELESKTGKKFGGNHPLLVSVRSGAKVSIPGMMDTILNIGLNDTTVKALAKTSGNSDFAYDSYKRLIRMFSEVVYGLNLQKLDHFMRTEAQSSELALEIARKNVLQMPGIQKIISETITKEIDEAQDSEIKKYKQEIKDKSKGFKVKLSKHGLEQLTKKCSTEMEYAGKLIGVDNDSARVKWPGGLTKSYKLDYLEVLRIGTPVTMNKEADDLYGCSKSDSKGKISEWYSDDEVYIDFTKLTGSGGKATYDVRFDTFFSDDPETPSKKLLGDVRPEKIDADVEKIKAKYDRIRQYLEASNPVDMADWLKSLETLLKDSGVIVTNKGNYKVGDRVIGIKSLGITLTVGMKGTIKIVSGENIGVEWDKPMGGHNLGGLAKSGHGWELPKSYVKKVEISIDWLIDDIAKKNITNLMNPEFEVELMKKYVQVNTGKAFPQESYEQLRQAILSVFKSWNNSRAVAYRNMNKIPHDFGTAVNIQSMAFGNLGENSGTGVCFSRNPITGKNNLYGEFLIKAQGGDVVAGYSTPMKIEKMKKYHPDIYQQLLNISKRLESHYQDTQDIEFTIQQGTLYILQTRAAKCSARATAKIAVDMVNQGLISMEHALIKLDPSEIKDIFAQRIDPSQEYDVLTKGIPASAGIVSGVIALSSKKAMEMDKQGKKCILVRDETDTNDITGVNASQGILTRVGGTTSHAALVARAMNKCCITGCDNISIRKDKVTINGVEYSEGDNITLNGNTGEVISKEVRIIKEEKNSSLETLLKWAAGITDMNIQVSVDTPAELRKAIDMGYSSIGLYRTEHHFFINGLLEKTRAYMASKGKKHKYCIESLVEEQSKLYSEMLHAAGKMPMRIRLLSIGLDYFLPSNEEKMIFSSNPKKGKEYHALPTRTEKSSDQYDQSAMQEAYVIQAEALCKALKKSSNTNIELLIPSYVPQKQMADVKDAVYKIIRSNNCENAIIINDHPESICFVNDKQKTVNQGQEIIVTNPAYISELTLGLAQKIIRGE